MSKTSNGKPRRDRGEVLDSMPPNALESERALLSGILYSGGIDQDVSIPAYEFYDPRNQAIWEVLVSLSGEGLKIDHASFMTEMKKHRRWGLDGLDSAYAISEVATAGGSVTRQAWHADRIHDAHIKRTVSHHAEFLLQKARGPCEVSELQDSLKTLSEFVTSDRAGAGKEPLPFTKLLTGGELLNLDLRPSFLVKGVLVDWQPMIVGGRSKTLKTSLVCDLVVALGSGTPFLGRFDARHVPVGFWSGESGAATIRDTALRCAEARGLSLGDTSTLWSFDLPRLSDSRHLEALEETILAHGLKVAILDPLYLSLLTPDTAGGASNLFMMGSLLQGLTRLGQRTGATIVLCHHFRKGGQADDENPAALEELAQSGVAEWARQWILLQRRFAYQNDGKHALWMRCGGSAGHSSLWGVAIDEGTIDPDTGEGRRWEVTVSPAAEARKEAQQEKENRKAAEQEKREGEHRERLLTALKASPGGDTARGLKEASGLNTANFGKAIACLLQEGRAERCKIKKGNREEDAFRPTGK